MLFPCMSAISEFWDRSQNNAACLIFVHGTLRGSTFFWFKLRCSKTPRFPPAKWWSHLPLPSGNPEGSWGERVWNHSNQRWADKLGSWNWLGVQMNTIHGPKAKVFRMIVGWNCCFRAHLLSHGCDCNNNNILLRLDSDPFGHAPLI